MTVRIGLVGIGTVGGGCVDIIQKHRESFQRHFGIDIELVRVCSLDKAQAEAHGVGELFTDDFNEIIDDPAIDVVVELSRRTRSRAPSSSRRWRRASTWSPPTRRSWPPMARRSWRPPAA